MAGPEAPLHQHLGTIAYEYALGEARHYYVRSTRIPTRQLERTLRDLAFRAVWGEDYGLLPAKGWTRPAIRSGARFWGAKAFPDEPQGRGLGALYPEARFVYLHRSGIDVVESMARFSDFAALSFESRCRFWASRIVQYRYLAGWDRAVTIRFDDFVATPDTVFRTVFSHLGIPDDERASRFSESTIVHPRDGRSQQGSARDVLRQRPPAFETWSREERSQFIDICGPAMAEASYPIPFA